MAAPAGHSPTTVSFGIADRADGEMLVSRGRPLSKPDPAGRRRSRRAWTSACCRPATTWRSPPSATASGSLAAGNSRSESTPPRRRRRRRRRCRSIPRVPSHGRDLERRQGVRADRRALAGRPGVFRRPADGRRKGARACRRQRGSGRRPRRAVRQALATLRIGVGPFVGRLPQGPRAAGKGELEPAASQFREALRIADDFLPAAFYLGACYAAGGRDSEAVGAWQIALITETDARIVYEVLVDALLRLGEARQAVEILTEARSRWPDDSAIPAEARRGPADARPAARGAGDARSLSRRQPSDAQAAALAIG